jgi:hypothetical protein
MSANLPIGPLQIVLTETINGTTVTLTGTVQIINGAPASSPAGTNASLVLTIQTEVVTSPSGPPVTRQVNSSNTYPATWNAGSISADWSFQSGNNQCGVSFTGYFTNNLKGNGTQSTNAGSVGVSTYSWTAQLGQTGMGVKINGTRVGTISIAGSGVTFNVTIGNQSVTATAALDPDSGSVSPAAGGFRLGSYRGISGQFSNNTAGSGSLVHSHKKQSEPADNWGTDLSSR